MARSVAAHIEKTLIFAASSAQPVDLLNFIFKYVGAIEIHADNRVGKAFHLSYQEGTLFGRRLVALDQ